MIATNSRGKQLSFSDYNSIELSEENKEVDLSKSTPEAILQFANSRAEKDLSLFVSLAALEEDSKTKAADNSLKTLQRFYSRHNNRLFKVYNKQTGIYNCSRTQNQRKSS